MVASPICSVLPEAGNNPRRLLAKEARDDAAYLERLRGFRSGRQGPPEPPRAAQVLEIDDGPLSPTAAKQFSMVEIVEQQGGSAAATAEEQATDAILDLQKSQCSAEAKPRRRPLPLSDEEESGESEGEPAAVAYAAASGLPARQELDRGAASLPASLSNKVLQLQAMAKAGNTSEVLYESQSQEASPQAGLPSLRRGRHAFSDEAEHMPLGRSPPLSPSGEAPRSEVEVPHDALHVGPLDFASSFGGVDPAVVYVRLSNFAARRRGSLRLQAAEEADDGLEPFSPVIHAGTEPPTFMTDSRQKRRRSRSGSDYSQCSSPYGSSPNLQAVAEVSEDLPGHKAIEESLPRHESDDGRPADHLEHHSLERCCTWNDYRRTSEGPAEEEEIASIQRHLEAMNAAAADLNAAQESLAACMRRQRTMVQLWAVVSARLARAVGSKQLAKVSWTSCAVL
ncbi:CBS [Symbiodinium microadriaticum]|nr:CBS [Symbiodinium microadriaticum]